MATADVPKGRRRKLEGEFDRREGASGCERGRGRTPRKTEGLRKKRRRRRRTEGEAGSGNWVGVPVPRCWEEACRLLIVDNVFLCNMHQRPTDGFESPYSAPPIRKELQHQSYSIYFNVNPLQRKTLAFFIHHTPLLTDI
ncbi:Hypothetical protein NTJ_03790 [Nesidiocoris tenuis]|uniref:Uncharacterized protein n=1 Tax=Nesidiocoris tenuis TaxID=355587 RepID=A0ABN7AKT3_9HEMI|nr:Hypothetical protein NTJ_03790 [Nesidiocoris tenuis]